MLMFPVVAVNAIITICSVFLKNDLLYLNGLLRKRKSDLVVSLVT